MTTRHRGQVSGSALAAAARRIGTATITLTLSGEAGAQVLLKPELERAAEAWAMA
jgi:hypothetical protein